MKVIVFGATGMVGQGVLRECLLDETVESVLVVGRTPLAPSEAITKAGHRDKLREIVHDDLFDLSAIEGELSSYDACFFCIGVSAAGMKEADYRRVTYDLTLAVAKTLAGRNPNMTFVYVSGAGTDSTGKGRVMWARVKGDTENALLALPFRRSFMFRPAFIQPMHGIQSKTKLYRVAYAVTTPLYPLWKTIFPTFVTTTEQVGRAMLQVAKHGALEQVIENSAINRLAKER